ncbi:MAG TPA: hypothetical protein ENJ35_00190 [Gammaproteobacteria bacterium]|nr:hypothetical protein [Gammaproteobacteria bacterium]
MLAFECGDSVESMSGCVGQGGEHLPACLNRDWHLRTSLSRHQYYWQNAIAQCALAADASADYVGDE